MGKVLLIFRRDIIICKTYTLSPQVWELGSDTPWIAFNASSTWRNTVHQGEATPGEETMTTIKFLNGKKATPSGPSGK